MFRVYRHLRNMPPGAALTIGNFDGVHHGHQQLIQRVIAARKRGATAACVLLFEPHPQDFFQTSTLPTRLMSFAEKCRVLRDMGVDAVLCLTFNHQLASQQYNIFWQHLIDCIQPHYVALGEDFRFGRGRQGSVETICSHARQYQYTVEVVKDHCTAGERISSTRLRDAVKSQQLEEYQRLTGRPYTYHYLGIWQLMCGYYRANAAFSAQSFPLDGVYAVRIIGASTVAVLGVAVLYFDNYAQHRMLTVYSDGDLSHEFAGKTEVIWLAWLSSDSTASQSSECKERISHYIQRAKCLFQI